MPRFEFASGVTLTRESVGVEITCSQAGVEQIFTGEARIEVEGGAVRESCSRVAYIIAIFILEIIRLVTAISGGTKGHHGFTAQLGGGGELSCFQFANAGFQDRQHGP